MHNNISKRFHQVGDRHYGVIQSHSGFWVYRITQDRAQIIERFDNLSEAEDFLSFAMYIAGAARRLAGH